MAYAHVFMPFVFMCMHTVRYLCSTTFLVGPKRQCKLMFNKTRIVATIIYVGMIIVTIVVAVKTSNAGATIVCVIVQSLALTWYALSYIPFARNAVKKCVSSMA